MEPRASQKLSEKAPLLAGLMQQRLAAAAEEILGLFERTIREYEEELSVCRQESQRRQRLLDSVLSPQVLVYRHTDVADGQDHQPSLEAVLNPLETPGKQDAHIQTSCEDSVHIKQELVFGEENQAPHVQDVDMDFSPVENSLRTELSRSQDSEEHEGMKRPLKRKPPSQSPIRSSHQKQDKDEQGKRSTRQRKPSGFKCSRCHMVFKGRAKLRKHRLTHRKQNSAVASGSEDGGAESLQVKQKPVVGSASEDGSAGSLQVKQKPVVGSASENRSSGSLKVKQKPLAASASENRSAGSLKVKQQPAEASENGSSDPNCNTVKKKRGRVRSAGHKCNQCGKVFQGQRELRKHEGSHIKWKLTEYKLVRHGNICECPVCKAIFKTKKDCRLHIKVTHAKPFGCPVCPKRYTTIDVLKQHSLLHMKQGAEDKPFGCSKSNLKFKKRVKKNIHKK